MEVEKQIREIIEFYCGGTYENRNEATQKILQICQALQLQQTGVSGSFSETNLIEAYNDGYFDGYNGNLKYINVENYR